jgi:peptide/nickel transport system ATP-binding protein/oligopeptide transport system ATP-binding protein
MMNAVEPLLAVDGVTIEFPSSSGWVPVVEDAGFSVAPNETVALVGESGSGKTVTSLAVLGLLGYRGGRLASGSVRFEGDELVGAKRETLRRVRGGRVGMIFQQPMLTLNPAYKVGDQIAETIRAHRKVSRKESWTRAVDLLDRVGIHNPSRRAHDYPHMYSGGMCQRAMIAQALSCEPSLLIADEPTTALDVSVQAKIIELLRDIQAETGIGVLLITHDLAVVSETAHRVVVMYGGQIVETGTADQILRDPKNPYTDALLRAIPGDKKQRFVNVPGSIPTPGALPEGCRFAPRCQYAVPGRCTPAPVPLADIGEGRLNRCVRTGEIMNNDRAGD